VKIIQFKIDEKYSPCFLAKNDPKCMFFEATKIMENILKVVKMTQNRSKAWAIDMGGY
jgi:hypothetical protein